MTTDMILFFCMGGASRLSFLISTGGSWTIPSCALFRSISCVWIGSLLLDPAYEELLVNRDSVYRFLAMILKNSKWRWSWSRYSPW
jgi:hypothetical protein